MEHQIRHETESRGIYTNTHSHTIWNAMWNHEHGRTEVLAPCVCLCVWMVCIRSFIPIFYVCKTKMAVDAIAWSLNGKCYTLVLFSPYFERKRSKANQIELTFPFTFGFKTTITIGTLLILNIILIHRYIFHRCCYSSVTQYFSPLFL